TFFFNEHAPHPAPPSFPTRRSSDLVANRTLWQAALVRAHQSKIAVYDTLFVELAVRERLPLVTFDAALLKAFPGVAVRPGAATRSEEHTSELQSRSDLVCRLLLEKK